MINIVFGKNILIEMEDKAKNGDSDAAYQLAFHYLFKEGNYSKHYEWLEYSYRLGNIAAGLNLAQIKNDSSQKEYYNLKESIGILKEIEKKSYGSQQMLIIIELIKTLKLNNSPNDVDFFYKKKEEIISNCVKSINQLDRPPEDPELNKKIKICADILRVSERVKFSRLIKKVEHFYETQ